LHFILEGLKNSDIFALKNENVITVSILSGWDSLYPRCTL